MWSGQSSPFGERNLDFEDSKQGPSPYTGEEDEKKRGAVLDMTNESEEVSKWEKLFDVLSHSKLINEDDWYDTYCIWERIFVCALIHVFTCLRHTVTSSTSFTSTLLLLHSKLLVHLSPLHSLFL